MSKYIVDIDDFEPHFKVDSIGVFGIGKSLSYSEEDHSWSRIKSIEEFEELNSDYINEHYGELQDEAYQRGHDDGYEAGCATAFKPVSDATYQRGLDEAMSAFKKLYSCGWESDWKAMGFEFDEGEWSTSFEFIIGHYTAAEIVEKVKAYEDKQKDRIEVGDEVISDTGTKFTVTGFANSDDVCGFSARGLWCFNTIDKLTKTGKHYDIASILEAMRK